MSIVRGETQSPLGTMRQDILVEALEDLEDAMLVLWSSDAPYRVRRATKRRKGRLAGVTLTWAAKGQRLWIRQNGPGSVRV